MASQHKEVDTLKSGKGRVLTLARKLILHSKVQQEAHILEVILTMQIMMNKGALEA